MIAQGFNMIADTITNDLEGLSVIQLEFNLKDKSEELVSIENQAEHI